MTRPSLENLGWFNGEGNTAREIGRKVAVCNASGHSRTDKDISGYGDGSEHLVTCEKCGYQYRYDRSG